MTRCWYMLACIAGLIGIAGCGHAPAREAASPAPAAAPAEPVSKAIRLAGTIMALEWQSVRTPQITGANARMTLTKLIPNGASVVKGDTLAEFDRTEMLDQERDAKAKVADLTHQLAEKQAQVRSDAAKRTAQSREAEADLEKARLQLRKGPILSEIDRAKNKAREVNAQARVASLNKSGGYRRTAEDAAVKVLELKLERQRVVLERVRMNLEKLVLRAPQDGMIAWENTWRSGTMGPPQEGDQMWPGSAILRIFNPARMVVRADVNEPDVALLTKASRVKLYLDAYPKATFSAVLESASPVANAGMNSPVRTFTAVFRIEERDPLLLPDLSAALEVDPADQPRQGAP